MSALYDQAFRLVLGLRTDTSIDVNSVTHARLPHSSNM